MLLEVCLLSQLEHIRVECWHLWLDVIEQVGLLHVTPVDFDLKLLKELLRCCFLGQQHALYQLCGEYAIMGEARDGLL